MQKSQRVQQRNHRPQVLRLDRLTEKQRTTIVVALQLFAEGWTKEVSAAAEDRRLPAFHSRGQIFEEHDLLSPTEIRELCRRIDVQNAVFRHKQAPASHTHDLITFAIPCGKCHVPMRPQPQPQTGSGEKSDRTRTVPVLTCPNCGATAERYEPAMAE